MLALVPEGVQREELKLYFDFMSLNRRCIDLLRRLKNRLTRAVPEVQWPTHLLEDNMLCGTPLFVLRVLSRENDVSARYRDVVKDLLDKIVLREGGNETAAARLRCRR